MTPQGNQDPKPYALVYWTSDSSALALPPTFPVRARLVLFVLALVIISSPSSTNLCLQKQLASFPVMVIERLLGSHIQPVWHPGVFGCPWPAMAVMEDPSPPSGKQSSPQSSTLHPALPLQATPLFTPPVSFCLDPPTHPNPCAAVKLSLLRREKAVWRGGWPWPPRTGPCR